MRNPVDLLSAFRYLGETDNVSYILDHQLRIVDTNRAWDRFALENDGDCLIGTSQRGRPLLDVIPGVLQPFYRDGFARTTHTRDRWEHDYECSSPTVVREFRMLTYPFDHSFVVTHALLISHARDEPAAAPSPAYERDGLITMCAHCRRVRHASAPERWDWVPAYLAPDRDHVTHGLCAPCFRYYYG
jgi:hypothetical protein